MVKILFPLSRVHMSILNNKILNKEVPLQQRSPSATKKALCNKEVPLQQRSPSATKKSLCNKEVPLQQRRPSATKKSLCNKEGPLQQRRPSATEGVLTILMSILLFKILFRFINRNYFEIFFGTERVVVLCFPPMEYNMEYTYI